jgi:hypothetical protein
VSSRNVNGNSTISSAIVGVTLLGDLEDVLAVVRTTIVLARSMKASLSLNLFEKDILSVQVDETSDSTLALLNSVKEKLRELVTGTYSMEVNVVAASFVYAGSVTMKVHSANQVSGHQRT